MEASKKKPDLKAKLIERLQDPLQLRVALCVTLLTSWYYLAYTPMKDRIDATATQLGRDRKRLALATDVEALRVEAAEFADRLPPRSDPNEFLQYVLAGVRAGPLKLVSLSPEKPKEAGPFEVASVRLELEGKYQDTRDFLRWVENDKRLLRVDAVSLTPDTRDPELLKVQLSVLGLMGVEKGDKVEKAEKAGPAKKPGGAVPKPKASTTAGKKGPG